MSSVRRRFVVVAAVLALGASACGGVAEGEDPTTSSPATDGSSATAAPTTTAPASPAAPTGGGDAAAAQGGDVVSVHYVGTLDDGEEFDASRDRGQPLSFTVGAGQMIAGFDAAVMGMAVGDVKTVRLAPAEAYGEPDPELIVDIGIDQIPEGTEVGQTLFSATGGSVVVLAIEGDTVTIDANHPLAGEFLTFEIEMMTIER